MKFEVIEHDQATWQAVSSERGITLTVFKDTLDANTRTGIRTRLVRFNPGGGTREIYTHDYHEEVYLIEGDQTEQAAPGRAQRPTGKAVTSFARRTRNMVRFIRSRAACYLKFITIERWARLNERT